MSSVPKITASSANLPQVAHTHSIWNNRIVIVGLVIGACVLLYYAIQHFLSAEKKVEPKKPELDLTKRIIAEHFPQAANGTQQLLFSSHAAGIIKVHSEVILPAYLGAAIHTVFIKCYFRDQLFFTQEMTRAAADHSNFEVFVPELPYNDEVRVDFVHGNTTQARANFIVDQKMGSYKILKEEKGELKTESQPQDIPLRVGALHNMHNHYTNRPLSVGIAPTKEPVVNFAHKPDREDNFYHFQNTTEKVHILFFEIQGYADNVTAEAQRLVVSVVLYPGETKNLTNVFLRTNWEAAYQATHAKEAPHTSLDILTMADVVV